MNEYREKIVNTIEICDDDISKLYEDKIFDDYNDDLEQENQKDDLYDFSDSIFENEPKFKIKESVKIVIIHIIIMFIVYIIFIKNNENSSMGFALNIIVGLTCSSIVSFMTYFISEYFQRKKQWKADVNYALKNKLKLLYDALKNLSDFRIFLKGYEEENINEIKNTMENQELYIYYLIGFINYLVKNKYIIKIPKSKYEDIIEIKQSISEIKKELKNGINDNIFTKFKKIHNTARVLAGSLYLGYCEKFIENSNNINYKL